MNLMISDLILVYLSVIFFPFVLFSSTLLVSLISLLKAKHLDT